MAVPAVLMGVNTAAPAIQGLIGGNKTSCPKTVAGKLLGGVSGRNAKCSNNQTSNQMIPGISGSTNISFGAAQRKYNLPLILGAVVAAVLIFMPSKKGRRRR